MLKISEIFEISRENSYFERLRMVRMVRMVRSLADRTFQPNLRRRAAPVLLAGGDARGHELLQLGLRGPERAARGLHRRLRVLEHLAQRGPAGPQALDLCFISLGVRTDFF